MADTITLLAGGQQTNVDTEYRGATPFPSGYMHGTIPPRSQVKGDAVDVTDYALLRAELDVTAMTWSRTGESGDENGRPDAASLHVSIEHAPAAVGPWQVLHDFGAMRRPGKVRVTLGAFEPFVRVSYYWARHDNPSSTITDNVSFSFGVSAEAVPAAV